jgi:cytochrome c oxidase cbb3-type subunit 1
VFSHLVSASVWLAVGTACGLFAAIKPYWLEAMEIAILSFGRIRPVHTNLVMFGWSSMALVGLALFAFATTSRSQLYRPEAAWFGLYAWHIAMILTVVTLSLGISRVPQEYREIVWPIMDLYAGGLLAIFICAYGTVAHRKLEEVYVSNWYVMAAFCWCIILVTIAYLAFCQNGMGNVVIQGYFIHTAVGMWFTPLVLGITYYALP